MSRILLGVSGGIAAYKSCELVRLLVRAGHDVVPLVTSGAERFVRAETFTALARRPAGEDVYLHLTRADVLAVAEKLNAGLKKLSSKLKSGRLIYTDSVSERGTTANQSTEAFVWGDPLDVVYIEEEFFGSRNTLTGLTNWARIVVHELTHRELKTEDHAYEHQGINPNKLTAAKAVENADSWAWFCADCAGALTEGVIKNAMDR